jgi:hypothetical protein
MPHDRHRDAGEPPYFTERTERMPITDPVVAVGS